MSGITFEGITKDIDNDGRFEDLSLEIEDGDIVALTGEKGCGRSDLIRMIEGVAHDFKGSVYIGGKRISSVLPRVNSASLANEMPLFGTPRMEIRRLIQRLKLDNADERINDAFKALKAEKLSDTRWYAMNREERLTAGMARAMAIGAEVVLFNEPFTKVDVRTAARMRLAILRFRRIYDATFVISTDLAFDALAVASKVVFLDKGKVRQYDTPQNIYDNPVDLVVAKFFGTFEINTLRMRLDASDDRITVTAPGISVLLASGRFGKRAQEYDGKDVIVGVRPENIRSEQAFISVSPDTVFDAKVELIETAGTQSFVHMSIPGTDNDFVAKVDPRFDAHIGEMYTFAIDANHVQIFDAETGRSIR